MADDGRDLALASRVAQITARAANLEQLARPFLELLEDLTGFESTYVTVLHWDDFKQEVRYARNTGAVEVTEGVFVEWSDTLCRRAMLEGRWAVDDVPSVWPDSDAAREMGIVSYVSVPIVTPGGSTFGTLCAASARSVHLADDAQRVMELFARLLADQAERERHAGIERDRVAMAAMHASANAAAIAAAEHKLKTPLSVLRAAAVQLERGSLRADDRAALLEAIGRQTVTLEDCIHELLLQSHPASPAPEIELSTVLLEPLLVRILSVMRLVAPDRAITLSCSDRLIGQANPVALVHVLEHVLDNAIKYSPPGSPIEVVAEPTVDPGEGVAITVTDRGPGIGDDALFGAFQRGDSSRGTSGTGMGLYIVRSLVESMGGTAAADAQEGQGTRLRIVLPAPSGSATRF